MFWVSENTGDRAMGPKGRGDGGAVKSATEWPLPHPLMATSVSSAPFQDVPLLVMVSHRGGTQALLTPSPLQPLQSITYFSFQTVSFSSLWPLWP